MAQVPFVHSDLMSARINQYRQESAFHSHDLKHRADWNKKIINNQRSCSDKIASTIDRNMSMIAGTMERLSYAQLEATNKLTDSVNENTYAVREMHHDFNMKLDYVIGHLETQNRFLEIPA